MTHYNKLANAHEVNQSISAIATQILQNHEETPLFVALLRGAAPFSAKLMTEIVKQSPDYHPELDYMMVSTYGTSQHAGEPHIVTDLAPSTTVSGREVIVIDDVLDKGITASFVSAHLKARGASNVQLAVLCDKKVIRQKQIEANYKGFTFEDKWLVGMGMDDTQAAHEGYRWREEIWEITR